MKLSNRIEKIKLSSIIKIADKVRELEKTGIKIIKLGTGEPNFDTPNNANLAAVKALNRGLTHYSNSRGISQLREKLCEQYNKKFGINLNSDKNILITPGAKQAIFYAILSIINKDDEVIILTPGWVSYEEIVKMAEGKAVFVDGNKEDNFEVDYNKIKAKVTKKTKAIILNSPNNPTGKTIARETLSKINRLCLENDILLIADEIYDQIIFKNCNFTSILSVNSELKNCVYINGFSKAYAMTGWRLGYIISSQDLIGAMLKLQQNTISCPTTFTQYGALEAMEKGDEFIRKSLDFYQTNKNILLEEFKKMKNFRIIEPEGGLYAFIDISKVNKSSYDFCLELIDKCKVSAIPGIAFGNNCEGFIRICLATEKKNIYEFITRIKNAYN